MDTANAISSKPLDTVDMEDAAGEARYCTILCRQLLEDLTDKYQVDGCQEIPSTKCLQDLDGISNTEQGLATLDWIGNYRKIAGRLNILYDYIVRADDALKTSIG